jgi:hypothetical protein
MRLFLFAIVLWLAQMLARRRHPTAAVFWIANCIVAFLFAAAYLPAAAIFVPLGKLVTLSVLSANGIAGLVFGYLCFYRGLEAAIMAHFIANLVVHFLGPLLAG